MTDLTRSVLREVVNAGPITSSGLAARLTGRGSRFTASLLNLEADGLIKRRGSPTEWIATELGRNKLLILFDNGLDGRIG